jgi:hypothetical protein
MVASGTATSVPPDFEPIIIDVDDALEQPTAPMTPEPTAMTAHDAARRIRVLKMIFLSMFQVGRLTARVPLRGCVTLGSGTPSPA